MYIVLYRGLCDMREWDYTAFACLNYVI